MKKKNSAAAEIPDEENPEWTMRDFAEAKRIWEIPELAHLSKRKPGERGPQRAPTKQQITLRLDPDVIERFRATGMGWQSRINEVLKRAKVG